MIEIEMTIGKVLLAFHIGLIAYMVGRLCGYAKTLEFWVVLLANLLMVAVGYGMMFGYITIG